MKFRVVHQPAPGHARSPFRVVEQTTGREVDWINRYLDREVLRRVADITLSSYAYDLLHFLRWWESVHHTHSIVPGALTESTLLDYVRFQSAEQPQVSGSTINHRLAVVDRALRILFPDAPGQAAPGFQINYLAACAYGSRQAPASTESPAREDAEADHRAAVGRPGGAILVQFPHLTRLGHRGINAVAGPPVPGSAESESR